ncbi:MAG: hypothetical protein IKI84_11900 [Clostridia bacterium]|nr:hypothetical protein [Clostridia bacterium]
MLDYRRVEKYYIACGYTDMRKQIDGLNPEAYLNHLLTVLPKCFSTDPKVAVDGLMPWSEEILTAFGEGDKPRETERLRTG